MNERLRELRKALGMSMEEFGKLLGITKSGVSDIENGRRSVTDQHIKVLTIQSLKGEYLNEAWLRTGEGQMFKARTNEELLTEFAADLLLDADDSFKKKVITALAKMDEETWAAFEKWFWDFIKEFQNDREES